MVASRNRVGRNDKCPCGSGEKYKRCCWMQREKHFNQFGDSGFSPIEPDQFNPTPPPRNRISPKAPLDAEWLKNNEWMELQLDVPLDDGTLLSIIGFQSAFWVKTHGVDIGSNVEVHLPIISYVGPAILTEIRPAEWTPEREGEVKAVFHCEDENDGGLLVLGARRSPTKGCFAERCANIRFVSLELIEYKGNMARRVNLTMLRSLEWLNKQNARIGGSVYLDAPGTDLQGWAKIQNIEPCLSAEKMSEQKQFGEFKPWSGRVGDLKIASESEPIGVMPSHPFRSHDRNDWVEAGRLEPGERVKTLDGTSVVEWYVMREKPEDVYNIEVEGDHVYRVGQSGILVHNASCSEYLLGLKQSNETRTFTPGATNASDFQSDYCGSTEYHISSGSTAVWADGIREDGCVVLDCKYPENPDKSPQLGEATPFFTMIYRNDQLKELRKYETVISDSCNPLTKLNVVCVKDAVPFWTGLVSQLSIDTEVVGV